MKNNNVPIHLEIRDFINQTFKLTNTEDLYNKMCEIRTYIVKNKKLNNEFNLRIKSFEDIRKKKEFKEQFNLFTDTLEVKKKNYTKTLPTDDVNEIFYFPTMGRAAVYYCTYDVIYPNAYKGVYELYYAFQGINRIGIFPKEVFEETRDFIDFYILKSLDDYTVLPKMIGSSDMNEYYNKKTLYRLDDCEDKFLICWLRAVLLGVLNQLKIYSKNLSDYENKFPVVLQYFDETKDFTLDKEPFKLTKKEIEFLLKIAAPATTQDKKELRGYVSKINIKARKVIGENIITDKTSNKLYRIDENIALYKD